MYDGSGSVVPIAAADNPHGVHYAPWETAGSAIDGNFNTKWLDGNFTGGEVVLRLQLGSHEHIAQYELVTSSGASNANRKRDPTHWTFGHLSATGVYQIVSTVVGFAAPNAASTSYGRFFSFAPPPPPP